MYVGQSKKKKPVPKIKRNRGEVKKKWIIKAKMEKWHLQTEY